MASEPTIPFQEGDEAPEFTAKTNGGATVSLSDFKGRHVVLYFYPKDDTPGCTKEACGFRDAWARYRRRKVAILGVSPDSVRKHDRFVEKFDLPFILVADVDKKISEAYGVWGKKKFMGREYMGVHRVTFLIDPAGRVQKIWPKVKPEVHADEVLDALI